MFQIPIGRMERNKFINMTPRSDHFAGCHDASGAHGRKLFSCETTGYICPSFPMKWLEKFVHPVILSQFFCKCPVGVMVEEIGWRRRRQAIFYYHCHCPNVGSLQCQSAYKLIVLSFMHFPVQVYDGLSLTTVPVCCQTWLCCPFEYLGGYKCGAEHGYWFIGSQAVFEYSQLGSQSYIPTVFPINRNVKLLLIECRCRLDHRECRGRMSTMFNYARVINTCSCTSRAEPGVTWTARVLR